MWKFYEEWKDVETKSIVLKKKEIERVVLEARRLGLSLSADDAESIIDAAGKATIAIGIHITPDSILLQAKKCAEQQDQADFVEGAV